MIIRSSFLNLLRWALRFHGFIHFLELLSAVYEQAYMTASLAFIAGGVEVLASFFLPDEHIHFRGLKTEIHEQCDDEEE